MSKASELAAFAHGECAKVIGKLVFGMMQSLDGYVAGVAGGPGSDGYVAGLASGLELPLPGDSRSRHFNDYVRGLAGLLCGRLCTK